MPSLEPGPSRPYGPRGPANDHSYIPPYKFQPVQIAAVSQLEAIWGLLDPNSTGIVELHVAKRLIPSQAYYWAAVPNLLRKPDLEKLLKSYGNGVIVGRHVSLEPLWRAALVNEKDETITVSQTQRLFSLIKMPISIEAMDLDGSRKMDLKEFGRWVKQMGPTNQLYLASVAAVLAIDDKNNYDPEVFGPLDSPTPIVHQSVVVRELKPPTIINPPHVGWKFQFCEVMASDWSDTIWTLLDPNDFGSVPFLKAKAIISSPTYDWSVVSDPLTSKGLKELLSTRKSLVTVTEHLGTAACHRLWWAINIEGKETVEAWYIGRVLNKLQLEFNPTDNPMDPITFHMFADWINKMNSKQQQKLATIASVLSSSNWNASVGTRVMTTRSWTPEVVWKFQPFQIDSLDYMDQVWALVDYCGNNVVSIKELERVVPRSDSYEWCDVPEQVDFGHLADLLSTYPAPLTIPISKSMPAVKHLWSLIDVDSVNSVLIADVVHMLERIGFGDVTLTGISKHSIYMDYVDFVHWINQIDAQDQIKIAAISGTLMAPTTLEVRNSVKPPLPPWKAIENSNHLCPEPDCNTYVHDSSDYVYCTQHLHDIPYALKTTSEIPPRPDNHIIRLLWYSITFQYGKPAEKEEMRILLKGAPYTIHNDVWKDVPERLRFADFFKLMKKSSKINSQSQVPLPNLFRWWQLVGCDTSNSKIHSHILRGILTRLHPSEARAGWSHQSMVTFTEFLNWLSTQSEKRRNDILYVAVLLGRPEAWRPPILGQEEKKQENGSCLLM